MKKLALILFLALEIFSIQSLAIELDSADSPADPAMFPTAAFSAKQCSASLPIPRGKNPWLKQVKKKVRGSGMDSMAHEVTSYYVVPAAKAKRFAVINIQDSMYDTATALEKIDCKHGLLYFRKSVGEVAMINYYRVYDLYTGAEYRNTEGAVTMSPDGRYLLSLAALDREQKCGRSGSCEVSMKLYECAGRETKHADCKSKKDITYQVNAKGGKNAAFSVVPVNWNWLKIKNRLTLKIGGSRQSPAKITCTILPKYSCKAEGPKYLEISEKN
jgi:hypothetical protein